jgi:RNA-directed DNA polymerase
METGTDAIQLRKRGVGKDLAAQTAGSVHGPWQIAGLNIALPNTYFDSLGLPAMVIRS